MLEEITILEIDGSSKGDIHCAVGMPGTELENHFKAGIIRPPTYDVHEMQHWRKTDWLSTTPHYLKHSHMLMFRKKKEKSSFIFPQGYPGI